VAAIRTDVHTLRDYTLPYTTAKMDKVRDLSPTFLISFSTTLKFSPFITKRPEKAMCSIHFTDLQPVNEMFYVKQ